MDRPPADDRSAISLAYAWATRVIVIAAEMVIPGLVGYWIGGWIDSGKGARIVLMLLGFSLGITIAIRHLLRMTAADTSDNPSKRSSDKSTPHT